MKLPLWKQVIYSVVAIPMILGWMLTHQKKVWEQAKKEYGDAWGPK